MSEPLLCLVAKPTFLHVSEAHVFICYGALSCDAAVRIASGVLSPLDKTYFLLSFPSADLVLPPGATALSMDPPPEHYSEWRKPFAIAAWFSQVLERLAADGVSSIVAYLPHPFELPANFLAYSDPRVRRLELLPDGLLNYTKGEVRPENPLHALRFAARVTLRWLAARRQGLAYRPLVRGHLTQYESLDYARTWTEKDAPTRTKKGEVRVLPPRPGTDVDGQPRGTALLILDQELRGFVGPRLAEKMRTELLRVVESTPAERVYYKAHPRGENRTDQLERHGIAAHDVSGPELAEALVSRLGITHLVGFYSTPLLLPSSALRARISVLPETSHPDVRRPRFLDDVKDALRASGADLRLVR